MRKKNTGVDIATQSSSSGGFTSWLFQKVISPKASTPSIPLNVLKPPSSTSDTAPRNQTAQPITSRQRQMNAFMDDILNPPQKGVFSFDNDEDEVAASENAQTPKTITSQPSATPAKDTSPQSSLPIAIPGTAPRKPQVAAALPIAASLPMAPKAMNPAHHVRSAGTPTLQRRLKSSAPSASEVEGWKRESTPLDADADGIVPSIFPMTELGRILGTPLAEEDRPETPVQERRAATPANESGSEEDDQEKTVVEEDVSQDTFILSSTAPTTGFNWNPKPHATPQEGSLSVEEYFTQARHSSNKGAPGESLQVGTPMDLYLERREKLAKHHPERQASSSKSEEKQAGLPTENHSTFEVVKQYEEKGIYSTTPKLGTGDSKWVTHHKKSTIIPAHKPVRTEGFHIPNENSGARGI